MPRPAALAFAVLIAVSALAVRPAATAAADEHNGDAVVISGKLTVDNKGALNEVFRVNGYKLRGVSREKLVPLLNKAVRVTGEFRQLFGELVLYVSDIAPAPKDD